MLYFFLALYVPGTNTAYRKNGFMRTTQKIFLV